MLEKKKKWNLVDLKKSIKNSTSIRQVIEKLGLIPAGGNYTQVKKYIDFYKISTKHFKGKAWNKGLTGRYMPIYKLGEVLVLNSNYQSYKLKTRLFKEKIKEPKCEMCGWAKFSKDGRLPLELDHINGDRHDNRIKNLRILCPNCHSLQLTHRAKNIKR